MPRRSREREDPKAFDPIDKSNVITRPFLLRLYAILGLLAMTLALLAVVIYLNATLPSGTQVDISAAAPAVSALARNHRVRRGAMEPGATQTPLTRRLDIDVGPVETAGPVFELGRRQADPTPANTEWCVTGTFADGRVTSCGFAWLGGTALAYCDGWWPVNRCPACLLPVAPRTTTPSTAPPSAPPPPPEDPTVATAPTMATADPEPEPEPETVGPLIAAPVAPATSTDAPAPVPPAAVTSGPAAAPVAPSSSTTLVALPLVPSIAFSSVPIAAPPPAVVVAVPSPLDPFVPLVVTVLSSPAAATTVPASFPPVSGAPVLPPAPASSAAAEVAAGQPSTVVGSVGIPPSAATMARHTVVQPSLSPVVSSSPNASGDNTTVPDTNAPAPVALAFPVSRTFLGSYLPLLVARAFTMLVTGLGTQASAFEGVRRLLGNVGASAAALAGGAVLTLAPTAVGGVAAHVGSAIVADAMWLDTAYCAAAAGVDGLASLNPCWPPRLAANPGILVTLATLLGIVAVSLVAVAMLWWKMPKNIAADPTSIAGVAAVMGHPEIEREFVALDGEMDMTELMERLEGRKFMLGEWEMAPGRLRWGLMPAPVEHGARHDVRETGAIGKAQGRFERMSQSVKRTLAGWKTARLCADVAFAALIVSLFIVCCVAVAHVDNPRRVFVAYSPKRFGAMRILFAALGIVISLYWGMLFRDAQTFAPYARLASPDSAAHPMPTILLHRHTLPLTAFVPLLRSNHVVPAAVAFAALISEILVVTLAGLPYRPGQLRSEYVFCGVASAVLLAIMLGIAVWAATWRALAVPHLPRRPDSVAAVMTYVAGTRMVADFEGIERVGVRERDRVIVGLRKRYVYGHVERKSGFGSGRWVVDDVAGDVGRPGSKETDRTRSTV